MLPGDRCALWVRHKKVLDRALIYKSLEISLVFVGGKPFANQIKWANVLAVLGVKEN